MYAYKYLLKTLIPSMIICITGASGFIGQRLALRYLTLGDSVEIFSRRSPAESGLPKSLEWHDGDSVRDDSLIGRGGDKPFKKTYYMHSKYLNEIKISISFFILLFIKNTINLFVKKVYQIFKLLRVLN